MRDIHKKTEPASLTRHRKAAHADYDNFPDKDELRDRLVAEQRGICCYCMARIRADANSMKIEHWHCREGHPKEELDYSNLLASCLGGEGTTYNNTHCDTHKGNADISCNPADPSHQIEGLIRYRGDGVIYSDDPELDRDLDETLNLNTPFLVNNRKGVLDGFVATLQGRGGLQRQTVERWIKKWNGESDNDDLRPYCQVVVYWLRKRLMRLRRA